jgi:RHS repeat-associated protein
MVKSVVNGVTTYYVGGIYEKEVDGGTTTERKYYSAGSKRIAMRVNGTLTWLLGDHLGSTSVTADASGAFQSEMRYTAFGETRFADGTTPTDYRYTGQRHEAEFGLYFYKARWYDPASAHFTQADILLPSLENPSDLNRYAYVRNNPLRYIDPTGLFSEEQLEKWYGENWMEVISENYSEEMALILTQANFGDLVIFNSNGITYGAIFIMDDDGNLAMWDLRDRSTNTVDNIDQNSIDGFFTQETENEYSLSADFSGRELQDTKTLPNDWNNGVEQQVVKQYSLSIEEPSIAGWIGFGFGIAGLFIPALREYEVIATLMGLGGIGVGIADLTKINTIYTAVAYPEPDPRYPNMKPTGTPPPPITFTQ